MHNLYVSVCVVSVCHPSSLSMCVFFFSPHLSPDHTYPSLPAAVAASLSLPSATRPGMCVSTRRLRVGCTVCSSGTCVCASLCLCVYVSLCACVIACICTGLCVRPCSFANLPQPPLFIQCRGPTSRGSHIYRELPDATQCCHCCHCCKCNLCCYRCCRRYRGEECRSFN